MPKGFSAILILVSALIITAVLLVPFPYYFDGHCDLPFPCLLNDFSCCKKEGWYLGDSLWKQIVSRYSRTSRMTPQPIPSPTPDETANSDLIGADWKTYINQKHQISFKYPSTWEPIPHTLTIIQGPNGETLDFNSDGSLMNECMKETSISKVSLDNVLFTKTVFEGVKFGAACEGGALGTREIWIQPQSELFGFQFRYTDSNAQEAEKTLDQIFSTFKFLSVSPSPTGEDQKSAEGKICGGFGGEKGQFACPVGYKCKYPEPMYPDAQGQCVRSE